MSPKHCYRLFLESGMRQRLQGLGVAPSTRVQFPLPLGKGTKPLLSAPGEWINASARVYVKDFV